MTEPLAQNPAGSASRRDFLKTSAATALGAAALLADAPAVHAGGSDVIRVGLIGCGSPRGGRGRGAAEQCVNAGPNVKLIAMADLFRDHLEYTRTYLKRLGPDKIDVPDSHCFVGFNAYKDLLALKEVDLVILTSPPGFRPAHIKAAVAAGKHVFAEKPVATDGPGVRSVIQTCAEAKKKGLSVVSGLCWRYDLAKQETFKRIHDGGLGDIVAMQCTYNTGPLWVIPRQPKWTDMEWQCRNWLYFAWLSGDFNVEQHIHSLDKMGWAMNDEYPVEAVGLGGRQVRTGPEYGHIFDHHSVVYTFANGVKAFANCRQQDGCAGEVNDFIFGTQGTCNVMKHTISGKKRWHYKPAKGTVDRGMYQREHDALIAGIRAGKPLNNGNYMTKSTLMAIMGRMATYTGQVITWEDALNSKEDLMPAKLEFGDLPVPPVARPGITKFI
jgi:predicted dehydrogenase